MSDTTEEKQNDSAAGGDEGGAEGQAAAEAKEATVDPVAESRAQALHFKDQAMRALADLDNFRKRARKEVDDAKKAGREELLKEFLPVFDNVERAILSAERATDVKAVVDGLAMVLRQPIGGISHLLGAG